MNVKVITYIYDQCFTNDTNVRYIGNLICPQLGLISNLITFIKN